MKELEQINSNGKVQCWLNGKWVLSAKPATARILAGKLRAAGWDIHELYAIDILVVFTPSYVQG